jgi:predicted GNAT family acetyltransferase
VTVTRHTDPDRFLAAAAPLLARNPAIESFAAAVVQGWRADPAEFLREAYVATYASGDELGFAVRRRGAPLILENSAGAAARAFADDMPVAMRDLAAVGGEREACEAFAERWNARFGTTHRLGVHMRHHSLTAACDVTPASGRYRVATSADGEWLERSSLAFAQEAGLTDSREFIVEGARKRLARRGFRIWEDEGRVAFAGWAPAGIEAARIAPVYTEPAARRRGYATALVATLVRELLDDGRRALFLLTDVANPTSNAIYSRIGFRPVSDTYRFDFDAPAAAAMP